MMERKKWVGKGHGIEEVSTFAYGFTLSLLPLMLRAGYREPTSGIETHD